MLQTLEKMEKNMLFSNLKKSLATVNWKLYRALLLMGLCPAIYTTVRTFLVGQMPGEWSYSIAGQLSWVNLIYEIAGEAIILPLFFFLGNAFRDKKEFTNRIRTGLLVSGILYTVFAIFMIIFAVPLLNLMAASPDIIQESAGYIRIESVAYIFSILYSFCQVALVVIGKDRIVYILTGVRLAATVVLDILLISQLPVSMNLGVNGIGISNIIVNLVLLIASLLILKNNGYNIFEKSAMSFTWMRDFARVGSISGLESLVRNLAYMVMIVRMVNVVNEQGVYWVANNFIWGWLLLPVTQLAELIKQEVSTNKDAVRQKSNGWFATTGIICLIWIVCIPLYKPFMSYVLGYSDVDKLFSLVMTMLAFYILYAFQNVFDSVFYGAGKTEYMLFESVLTNTVYYGIAFLTYCMGLWKPTLFGIALLFGFGNAFDSVVSWLAYKYYTKKYRGGELSTTHSL